MLPLEGITVVCLEQAVAAPFASRQLADLGARVIKIERPKVGDFARDYDQTVKGQSAYFVWLNRSKESLTLDVKHPKAAGVLARLIDSADVFIQNLAPGAAKRLGLGGDTLLARNPRLIVCDISGYGDTGPYARKKAYDLLVQSEAGVLSVTGTEEAPSKVGISITDIGTGLHAYAAILAALYERERTGKGRRIEVTMFETMVEWMNHPLYYTHFSGNAPKRAGTDHATIVPYGRFRAGDGKHVMFGIQNEREWASFCSGVLKQPELTKDARYDNNTKRNAARAEVIALIEKVFAGLTAEDVVARLDSAGIANARLNSPEEVWNHPQLQARNRWREVESPAGAIPATLPPASFDGVEVRMDPIPAVGEHTDGILKALGYDAAELDALKSSGAV
ncbi:MAG: L-carnitine dehydratase/bile acid-inducible protein [Betaproteobacteria bacterium]|nr:L-carnitine dehydratase/bile acid-inducible protein [Betaproteobacteria bacterium]